MRHFWNSIPESMLTLFMAITGGVDWEETLEPLRKISILAAGCMVVYVIITPPSLRFRARSRAKTVMKLALRAL